MAIAVAVTDQWDDGKRLHVIGTFTFSGNYPAAGEVPAFGAASGTNIKTSRATTPLWVSIFNAAGYQLVYTISSGKVRVNLSGTADAVFNQLAAAAYPAGLTGAVTNFYAIFNKV